MCGSCKGCGGESFGSVFRVGRVGEGVRRCGLAGVCYCVLGMGVYVLSEWAVCMGFGLSVLVGAARFGGDGARLTGAGGRNPPRMGIVSMCMCSRSGWGGLWGVCVLSVVGRCVPWVRA